MGTSNPFEDWKSTFPGASKDFVGRNPVDIIEIKRLKKTNSLLKILFSSALILSTALNITLIITSS